MVSKYSTVGLLAVGLLGTSLACAAPITTDFEEFEEFTDLSTEVAGLSFTNATVLTAGSSLNEIEFPPRSGGNAAYDSGATMAIDFAAPVESFSAYFTYLVRITLSAFDGTTLLGSVTSLFDANYTSSGNAPNELLQIGGVGSITRVTISGANGSFVMDDLTAVPIEDGGTVTVPEPNGAILLLAGLLLLAAARRRPVSSR